MKYEVVHDVSEDEIKEVEAETEEVKKKLNELELEAGLLHDPAYEAFLKLNRGKL